ncbi:sugar ABC transporter substrate-binding protein [Rathayibacter sp. AY2B5]|uniref:ABC transporter substrate-binding protein n=1 Tax=Rathayibacter sp. AY2B5 TaxID=2080570 RepID=UPI000CE8823F|nr:sugar ABC transporter substrate-binding protein [Rathayibacter sp. AY2B5]PPG43668.1 sugar ABC transporter substrate-binding protein [Rathayibacter sp. AY2B5]
MGLTSKGLPSGALDLSQLGRAVLDRRRFLGALGVAASVPVLSGCGFAPASPAASAGSDTLTFTTWGTDAELAGFQRAIDAFQSANAGATVTLNAVPYEQMFTNIDAQLQAGNPPDVFRVPYYTFGSYAGRDQLLDLSGFLDSDVAERFTDPAWAAVQSGGSPFGVPHHTDTSLILYNTQVLADAGVTSFPSSPEEAWTWEEFTEVGRKLRASLPAERYPFAYNWQGNGVTRWLSLLFQADGRFLTEDLSGPAIDSAAGRAAIDFSRSFFTDGLVPPSSSVQATTYASDLWYSQTTAMTFAGAFLIPDADSTLDFEWGATYSPRNVRGGGDFGGNALVATKAAKNPELAASFLAFVTEEEAMRDFCAGASLLPTRRDLTESGIEFAVRPELAEVFLGQAGTVQASDSAQVASPDMAAIITVLKEQLEQAFVGGRSTEDTIAGLTSGIAAATQ